MNMHALSIRAAIMAVLMIGLSVIMLHRHGQRPVRNTAIAPAVVTRVSTATTPVTLPTIHVQATVPARPAAQPHTLGVDTEAVAAIAEPTTTHSNYVHATMQPARLRLDMPYYSFGTIMPRASKE